MSARRALMTFTALLTLTACDPLFSTQYRQPLVPLAGDPCVEDALRSSRLISMVEREKSSYDHDATSSYHIVVRDTSAMGGEWEGEASRERRHDSTWVKVSYSYMGYATPPKQERARWEVQAHEILETVRAQCAPDVPSAIACKAVGGIGGQRGACSTGA
jgi:hypothetical protein